MNEWISVNDYLPEEWEDVIVTDGKDVWVDNIGIEEGHAFWNVEVYKDVTHWMPLPEPPKGAE